MSASRPRLVPLALVCAVLAISFAAIFFRKAQPTHPLASAGIRLAVAALLLSPLVVRARLKGRLPASVLKAGFVAGLLYAVHFGSWVASLDLTTVAASVTLVTATPLILAVTAAVTGKDRPSKRLWAALALSAVGVTVLGGTDLGSDPKALLGDVLALVGSAAMAGYLLLARRQGPTLDVLAFSGVACAVGAVVLLAAAPLAGVDLAATTPQAFGWLALAALFPQLVGHSSVTWALRHTTPTRVGLATVGEPVGATLLALWILGEVPSTGALVGCCITVFAVALALTGSETLGDAA